jgi:hypothetical protein
MYNTYVNTVFESMGSNRRERLARPRLVATHGSTEPTSPAPTSTPEICSPGRNTALRRWLRRRDHDALVASRPADIKFTWGNRHPGTAGFARWAAAAGQRIAEHGLNASTRDVDDVIGVARQCGVAPVAVSILADTREPEPARLRAFAVVVSALVGATPTPS